MLPSDFQSPFRKIAFETSPKIAYAKKKKSLQKLEGLTEMEVFCFLNIKSDYTALILQMKKLNLKRITASHSACLSLFLGFPNCVPMSY